MLAAGVIALGGLAAGLFFMFGSAGRDRGDTGRMATSSAKAPEGVTIDLSTTPAGATVIVDGKKAEGCAATPCKVKLPRHGETDEAELELWLEGYETAHRSVPRDRDAFLEVSLDKIAPVTAAAERMTSAPATAEPRTGKKGGGKGPGKKPGSGKPGTSDLDGFVDPFKK